MHELTHGRVVDGLCGGYERDAALAQVSHYDGIVVAVPCHAGELVDDDVLDVLVVADSLEHLLEFHPADHRRGRFASLDVLANYRQSELLGLALAGHALGRNRDAFRVVVGVDLARRGDTEVEDRAFLFGHCLGR
nr:MULTISPECIES: hypothetical protein [Sinomonas]